MTEPQRIQKLLAQLGIGSRRQIEMFICQGKITINGRVAQLGDKISLKDRLTLNGDVLDLTQTLQSPKLILYHKPVGQMCTRHDPQGRQTVFECLPSLKKGRWVMVGRLDLNSSGLLLFTTDGVLADRLMHPRNQFERVYVVRVLGQATDADLNRLLQGLTIEGQRMAFKSVKLRSKKGVNAWYDVTLTEGKNREIRRLFEAVGLPVNRLMRVSYAGIDLPRDLKPGQSRFYPIDQLQGGLA